MPSRARWCVFGWTCIHLTLRSSRIVLRMPRATVARQTVHHDVPMKQAETVSN